jgi:hypothetical protein
MRSANPIRRATGTAAVAVAALMALTGCFPDRPPPEDATASMDELTSALGRLPHVAAVTGKLRQVDAKDHPDEWIAEIEVRADTADLAVAGPVRERAVAGVDGASLELTLEVPRGTGTAPARVDPTDPVRVALADRLRRVDLVRSVDLDAVQEVVRVRGGTTWTEAATAVRPALDGGSDSGSRSETGTAPGSGADSGGTRSGSGSGSVTVVRGHGAVEVDATRPGPALLRVLDSDVIDDPSSQLGPTIATASADPGAEVDRSMVSGAVDDPSAVAALLAATTDEAADARLAPRTRFVLWQRDADGLTSGEQDGWLGLPLDAAAPDDLPTPGSGGAGGADAAGGGGGSGSASAPWTAVPVPAQTAAVRAFLDAAARTTGVPAEVTTGVEPCRPDGDGDAVDGDGGGAQTGTRATASTVVPVFTRYDDAQGPFEAIVAQWRADGFRASGRALGQDFFSAPSPGPDDVATASIRGTADGISLGAMSSCVGRVPRGG